MAEKELAQIVGDSNVLEDAELLETYSRDESFVNPVRPKCVVRPRSSDDIQALVKWANDTSTPLVPVSSGAPHFRGDTVPSVGGAVIVDMSGMKKMIRIDRRNRVAMIEPGVTFGELVPAMEKEGIRLNLPLLPRANKSVIGSMLEREPVIMPLYQWDALDPMVCVEIIFGTGEMFRTGSAAGPQGLEEQWAAKQAQVNPMGPGQTDFSRVVQGSQGTMGIINWSTVKCEFIPNLQKPYLVGSDKLEKLSELIYKVLWLKMSEENFVVNNVTMAALLAKDAKEYAALKDSLPKWINFFCLSAGEYFPEEKMAYMVKGMTQAAKTIGVEPVASVGGVSASEMLRLVSQPSAEPYWRIRQKGACQDIVFLSTLDRMPGFIDVMYRAADQCGYPSSDLGIYVQPMVQGSSCHCEFSLFYDPQNKKEAARMQELYVKASEALMNAGAFFSRPYAGVVDMVYRRDAETTAALRKVKKIFDPNNIMNPGKLCF